MYNKKTHFRRAGATVLLAGKNMIKWEIFLYLEIRGKG